MSDPTYVQPSAPPPGPPPAPVAQGNGLGIAALVVGIIAVLVSFIPLIGSFGGLIGAVAIVLGIVGLLMKGRSRGTSIAGVILGVVSIVVAIIMTVITAAAIGAAGQVIEDLDKSSALKLDDGWKLETDSGFTKVVGTVSNTSDKAVENLATITFDVLDASGANIGTCLGTTETVDAGGKWKFEASCMGEVSEDSTVRFKEITGF